MLKAFGPFLFVADGPAVSFFGFPYPTRMAVAQLTDGSAWVWSPVALTEELARAVENIGPVRHIVSPNKLHHLFLKDWAKRWPDARLYPPRGLARKEPELCFQAKLGNEPDPAWAADIDQAIFHGSIAMEEVVFFHRASSTVIIGDLVQRFPEAKISGWRGMVMRLDGLVGERGSTPREWRASFLRRRPARAARDRVLSWHAKRLLIAHGYCSQNDATAILTRALDWI